MPVRCRARSIRDESPMTLSGREPAWDLPAISDDDSFRILVKKLSLFIVDVIELPSTFEQLRTTAAGECLRVLVDHLADSCANPAIVHALLALKWHYSAENEHRGLSDARANACEIVAWRFLTRLSERDAVEYCLYEIPAPRVVTATEPPSLNPDNAELEGADERRDETTALIQQHRPPVRGRFRSQTVSALAPISTRSVKRSELISSVSRLTISTVDEERLSTAVDPTASFTNLNALEIAAVANAKRFLSQYVVQKIVTGIWNGDIIFWDSLSVGATKRPRFYNVHSPPDPFSRLRVPKYVKFWEVIFFAIFLLLYYSVLVEQSDFSITPTEVGLYLWFAAFLYDELSEWMDAGSIFYATDLWNLFDMIMIMIGFAFAILRIIAINQGDAETVDVAYDVLALEALFVMPRICSLLSLSPYWGTLIPCLKEMGKDFVKFMVLIIIIYVGFLTTFCLIGRDHFSTGEMTWKMTQIFYGSNSIGFEIMSQIDQFFGPPLMIIFITLSSILLMGSMTGILSNSFSRVITHAREEYLYVYSVYVLEASTSNRLTHFYPPFNLVALVMFRPLRYLCLWRRGPSDGGSNDDDDQQRSRLRAARILLLKATHLPIVAAIGLYEWLRRHAHDDEFAGFKGGPQIATDERLRRTASGRRSRSRPISVVATAAAALTPRRPGMPLRKESNEQQQQSRTSRRPSRACACENDDRTEVLATADTRLDELHRKVDQLTAILTAMQGNNGSDE